MFTTTKKQVMQYSFSTIKKKKTFAQTIKTQAVPMVILANFDHVGCPFLHPFSFSPLLLGLLVKSFRQSVTTLTELASCLTHLANCIRVTGNAPVCFVDKPWRVKPD